MKTLKGIVLLMLLVSGAFALFACQQNEEGLKSPAGKFTVKFDVTKDFKSIGTEDLDDISYVQYKISFYDSNNELAAAGEFANVYGWSDDAQPRPINKIFDGFKWSPSEDFVILPEAEWASAPGSPVYSVLNLNPNLNWKTANISMNIETWYGDMMVFGNVKDDCHNQVEMFDGKTGKVIVIAEAKSPIGYEIIDTQGDILYIRNLLDNCRMERDEEKFQSECFEFDIPAMKLTARPCR